MTLKQITKTTFFSSKTKIPNLVSQLIRGRLRFYIQVTADAIKRHQFILLLVLLLLGPMFIVALLASAKPLVALLNPVSMQDSLQIWSAFLLLNVLWSRFQRKAYTGGTSYQYLQSLPLSRTERIQVEFKVVLYIGSILFLPFIISIVYLFSESNIFQAVIDSVLLLLWGIGFVFIQMLTIQQNKYSFAVYLASFISPISLVIFDLKIMAIAFAGILLWVAYIQWIIGKKNSPNHVKLPQCFRMQATSGIFRNLNYLTLRKVFHRSVMTQRILFLVFSLSAIAVLWVLAQSKQAFLILGIELNAIALSNIACAFYLTIILVQIGSMQSELVKSYENTHAFWISLGITQRQMMRSELTVFLGITIFTSLPILIWVFLTYSLLKGLSLLGLLILGMLLAYHIFKKPDDVHGIVPLVLGIVWFAVSYFILSSQLF